MSAFLSVYLAVGLLCEVWLCCTLLVRFCWHQSTTVISKIEVMTQLHWEDRGTHGHLWSSATCLWRGYDWWKPTCPCCACRDFGSREAPCKNQRVQSETKDSHAQLKYTYKHGEHVVLLNKFYNQWLPKTQQTKTTFLIFKVETFATYTS